MGQRNIMAKDQTEPSGIPAFLKLIPQIKTPIQLTAFVATIVVFFLIRSFAPENIPAQLSGGMIGICIIVFTLVFNFLNLIPSKDRARVILILFGFFSVVVVVLVIVTGYLLLHSKSNAIAAIVETTNAQLAREESELLARLRAVAERKMRESAALSFSEWRELTESESALASQIGAIQQRKLRMQDTKTQVEAVINEVKRLTQRNEDSGVRRQATEAEEALSHGDLAKAHDLFRTLAAAGEAQTASANFWLGRISEIKADYSSAQQYYQKAADLAPTEAGYLEASAKVNDVLGRYGEARSIYDKLVSLYRNMPNRRVELAISLKDAGNVTRFADGNVAAIRYYQEAYDLAKSFKGTDKVALASIANDFGAYYSTMGQYTKASHLYSESLDIYRSQEDKSAFGFAELLNNFGYLRMLQAKYDEALKLLTEAISLETEIMGTNVPLLAITTANLANAYLEYGNLGEARTKYEHALTIAARTLGREHSRYGRILGLYGEQLIASGDLASAGEELRASFDILLNSLGSDHSLVALSQLRLAEFLLRQQALQADDISKKLSSAEAIMVRTSQNRMLLARIARARGSLLGMQGDYDGALKSLAVALNLQKENLGERHPEVAKTLFEHSMILSKKGGDRVEVARVQSAIQEMLTPLVLPTHPILVALRKAAS